MQKKMVFIVAAVALLAAGCGKKAPAPANTSAVKEQSNNQTASQGNGQLISLNDLMASGKPQKCTVTYTVNGTQNQGTVYFSGSNVRMDTTYELNGVKNEFSVISNGQNAYLWTSGSATGYKVPVQKNSTSTLPSGANKLRQDLDPSHPYQYDCSNWTVDSSEFTPPSSINFSEMSQPQSQTPSVDKAKACAACNYAGSNKAQCLASLGCN